MIRRASALAALAAAGLATALAGPALAAFPYQPQNGPDDYTQYKLPPSKPVPGDLGGKLDWMYASTPLEVPAPFVNPLTADKRELNGVRGAWLVDKDRDAPQAWHTTTGRPDVTIAVLDSGVQWNDYGKPMGDVRLTTRISKGETPLPRADRAQSTDAAVGDCAALAAREGERDLNGDAVFNVLDYACDSRVEIDPPKGVGPTLDGKPLLDPQDILIAFSDGGDDDSNGYADDMVGWDYVDDDNDPFDDVQYGHGSGEARGSAGEADNGGDLGTCPNCTLIHMRVGTSFVADVNNFALATIYAADNDVEVVQEALGTLNKSRLGADAVKYAYDHGVTVIASAADEAAQHHNWPSSYPYSIVVNSITHVDDADPAPTSYLMFNGCTNFSSRITVGIPSVSCSSDATERAAGMAGLVYAAAMNAGLEHPRCRRTDGRTCAITPNEVRQLMASGTIDGEQAADDVNFAQDPVTGAEAEGSCGGNPVPGCTDPFFALTAALAPRLSAPESYPARKGHDQFYGYGRVNMHRTVTATASEKIPPEVEVISPEWYEMVDPAADELVVKGQVWARGGDYTCRVYVAPGAYPKDTAAPDGDFVEFSRGACDGRERSEAIDGEIARISMDDVKALFPPTNTGSFDGPETGLTGAGTPNPGNNTGRPNKEPYSFVVKVVATAGELSGTDRRQAYLHRDQDMLDGFPRQLAGDVESSPVLADLDGDNRNELVVANSDGIVHAFRRDGGEIRELPGWPVRTDRLPLHPGSRAFASGAIEEAHDAVLTTPAIGDIDGDGTLEVVVASLKGGVHVFDGETGRRELRVRSRREFSGAPLQPFENVRGVGPDGKFDRKLAHTHRMEAGFIGSPVLADVDANDGGKLEIVAASLDRHVYVWNHDGSDADGWPLPVVDHSKLQAAQPFDPVTHKPYFAIAPDADTPYDQGAIIDTPAVGDLDGKPGLEIVIGTNESYRAAEDGGLNAGGLNEAVYAPLGAALEVANGRVFAIEPGGDPDGDPNAGTPPWLPGWPFKVGILQAGLLPMVGEGVTGSPVMGSVPCQGAEEKPRVGLMPAAGVAYVVNADGQSCFGRMNGKDVGLNSEGGAGTDQPFLAAVGHPAFGDLAGGKTFLAPVAGLQRALDVVLPEYQGGQDYLSAWQLELPHGTIRPGWPVPMNDLQFLTGPSVGDISPLPGEEVVAASAHHDLRAYSSAGAPAGPEWPKLTGDWSVANPTIGTFGTLDTDDDATRVIVHGTRNGRLLAYDTGADPCGPASWPRFHHDLANTGDQRRDAVPPGKPAAAAIAGGELSFTAPGDDLMCGTAQAWEVRTSPAPITPGNFADAEPVEAGGEVVATGEKASLTLPESGLRRYVAVRARDDQGNAGRPAVADRGPASNGAAGGRPAPAGHVPAAEAPSQTAPRNASSCLPSRARLTRRGIGSLRLGQRRAALVRRAGPPASERRGAMRWCVRGGGTVTAVLRAGRARLLVRVVRGKRRAVGDRRLLARL